MAEDPTTPPAALKPDDPARLGPYTLLGRVGRGGMGIVYLAEDAAGKRVAIKMISPELAEDESFRDRFRREVDAARRVRRFCTAPVLDARLDADPMFIVTEYVDGPNLDTLVRARGPLRGSQLEYLAVGVVTALTAIHTAGLVHRDLKPANVLLSSFGPRVIDFGIARALDTAAIATRSDRLIGTPAYIAPEILFGRPITPAADVFSWACVVAFAGTGHTPFEAPTVPAVLHRVAQSEPMLDGLDPALRGLVESALAKDSARRPTAQQLLDRLVGRENAQTDQVAHDVQRTWVDVAANPQSTRAAPVPGIPAPDGPGGTRAQTHAPPEAATAPNGHRTHRRRWVLAGIGLACVLALVAIGVALLPGTRDEPPTTHTTRATPADQAAPPKHTSLLYSTDFSGSDWSTSHGDYLLGGGFRVEDAQVASPYTAKLPEYTLVTATARQASRPGANERFGVVCHGNARNSGGYRFLVRADGQGAGIYQVEAGHAQRTLATAGKVGAFKTDWSNRIQAVCASVNGGKVVLRLWVNDTLVTQAAASDLSFAHSRAGVVVTHEGTGDAHTGTVFTGFAIRQVTG